MSAQHYVVKTLSVGLKVGTAAVVQVECAVRGVGILESHDETSGATACPDGSWSDIGPSRYQLQVDLNAAAKLEPTSFWRLLYDNEGQPAVITFEPNPTGDPGRLFTCNVPALPGVGAVWAVGANTEPSVTLPLSGKPAITDPVTP
jgi:hypothetical protein